MSITATATCGLAACAEATNHAAISVGMVQFGRNSAVPVLPATWTPGIAAAVPVPERTTSSIIARTWWAVLAETARRRTTGPIVAIRGRARRPPNALVA